MLIDSHCHLTYPDFAQDFDQVLKRARMAGVSKMLTICTKLEELPAILSLVDTHHDIYGTAGVHPHEASNHSDLTDTSLIQSLCLGDQSNDTQNLHPKLIALGECGLDYYYKEHDPTTQRRVFAAHILAGRHLGLPLIIHSREGEADMISIFDEMDISTNCGGGSPGVIHCFTGTLDFAKAVLDRGFYISVSGIATFKSAQSLRETLAYVPMDRLLVETDAPYLAPQSHRGKRNEPSFVKETALCVATLKGIPLEEVAKVTTDNFHRLFRRCPLPPQNCV